MPARIARNVAVTVLDRIRRFGLVTLRATRTRRGRVGRSGSQLKTRASTQPVERLSGGNQQKVVLAKWLATNPRLLVIDEPTRGIDVGTKAEVHRLLSELAAQGLAILMISSELPEVLGMADRVLVHPRGPADGRARPRRGDAGADHAGRDRPGGGGMSLVTPTVELDRRSHAGGRASAASPPRGARGAVALLCVLIGHVDREPPLPVVAGSHRPDARRRDHRHGGGRPDVRAPDAQRRSVGRLDTRPAPRTAAGSAIKEEATDSC